MISSRWRLSAGEDNAFLQIYSASVLTLSFSVIFRGAFGEVRLVRMKDRFNKEIYGTYSLQLHRNRRRHIQLAIQPYMQRWSPC